MSFYLKNLILLISLGSIVLAASCLNNQVLNNFAYSPTNPTSIGNIPANIFFTFTNGQKNNIIDFSFGGPCMNELICSFSGKSEYGSFESSNNNVLLTVNAISNKSKNYLIPFELTVPGICSETGTINFTVQGNITTPDNLTASITAVKNIATNGDNVDYYIKIKNNMNTDTFLELTSIGFLLDSQTNYEASLFKLKSNEERILKISVFIPPEFPATPVGTPLTWSFALKDKLFGQQLVFPVNLTVVGSITNLILTKALSSQTCIEARHGQETTQQMEITNDGEYTGPFTAEISVPDEVQDAISVSPKFFSLPKGKKIQFNLTAEGISVPVQNYPWNLIIKQGEFEVYTYSGCLRITPDINFTVKLFSDLTIKRNRKNLSPIVVKNSGDVPKIFTVTYDPSYLDFKMSIDPTTFRLDPGESKLLNVWFNTTMNTKLKENIIPFNITTNDSQKYSGLYDLKVITTGLSNETLLKITPPADQTIPNYVQQVLTLKITNKGKQDLTGIAINLYSDNSILKTLNTNILKPGETKKINFVLKTNFANYGMQQITINANSSEGEETTGIFQLNIIKQEKKLDLNQTETTNVLNLKLQNTGNVDLNNIKYFVVDPISNSIIQIFDSFDLNVGKQKDIRLPKDELQKIQDNYDKPIIIKFTADDQVLVQKELPLKTTNYAAIGFNPLYLILVIVVIICAYFLVIKKYE